MMNNETQKEPNKLKRTVIKEEFVELLGNINEAVVLNQMLYWSERIRDYDKFKEEEINRINNSPEAKNLIKNNSDEDSSFNHGWIYKSSEQLSDEVLLKVSGRTINNALNKLVQKKYLSVRNNPKHSWDRTKQYRVNLIQLQKDLLLLGFPLEGYSIPLENISNGLETNSNASENISNGEEINSNGAEDSSNRLETNSNRSVENFQAIPEITTEITSETTTESTNTKKDLDDEGFLNNNKNDLSQEKETLFKRLVTSGFAIDDKVTFEFVDKTLNLLADINPSEAYLMFNKAVDLTFLYGGHSVKYTQQIIEQWLILKIYSLKEIEEYEASRNVNDTIENFDDKHTKPVPMHNWLESMLKKDKANKLSS